MPPTPQGNKYICTITDYFTKWPEAAALKSKTAEEVAKVMFLLVMCRWVFCADEKKIMHVGGYFSSPKVGLNDPIFQSNI